MATEVPKNRCLLVWRLWQNLDGSLWQTAMVGSASSPPLWTGDDWRPILGTSVDTRILPPPLSGKESLLLLSRSGFACPVMTCISGMLLTAGYCLAKSMSHLVLIHPIRELPLDLGTAPYIAMRGHRFRMWFRHRTMHFPHLMKFL